MDKQELINGLRYLILKYVSEENQKNNLNYLTRDPIPVKGILANIDKFKIKAIEPNDGKLISDIYAYYC